MRHLDPLLLPSRCCLPPFLHTWKHSLDPQQQLEERIPTLCRLNGGECRKAGRKRDTKLLSHSNVKIQRKKVNPENVEIAKGTSKGRIEP